MKRVLIFGAAGMAGHMISMYLKTLGSYQVIDLCHKRKHHPGGILIDVHNLNHVKTIINEKNPDIIINCAGILNKGIDERPDEAIYVNAYFPKWLENYCRYTGIKIIHLSTDCVFSGRTGGYSEKSFPDGCDTYARTKILGEINNTKDLTIRTSIIGPEVNANGTGLFHWFMRQQGEVSGYKNVIWSGITTLELAKSTDKLIKSDACGLCHLTSETPVSKYNLLSIIKDIFNRNVKINPDFIKSNNKQLINTRTDISIKIPDYHEMTQQMKDWIAQYPELYKHYLMSS